jgi:hypothetical protein
MSDRLNEWEQCPCFQNQKNHGESTFHVCWPRRQKSVSSSVHTRRNLEQSPIIESLLPPKVRVVYSMYLARGARVVTLRLST